MMKIWRWRFDENWSRTSDIGLLQDQAEDKTEDKVEDKMAAAEVESVKRKQSTRINTSNRPDKSIKISAVNC